MSQPPISVIACEVLRLELEAVRGEARIHYMDFALHRTPKIMPERLRAAILETEAQAPGEIVMAYGLCANGTVGLSGSRGLVIPRCHDCIGILLGSPERYQEYFSSRPGTFYLFAGLIEAGLDPLTTLETRDRPRLGPQKADRLAALALQHYTHIAYIDNGTSSNPAHKNRFLENCAFFNKEPWEITADLDYVRRLIQGPRRPSDFITLPAGDELTAEAFY